MDSGLDPLVARRTWRTLEPIHGMIYFAPHAEREYERVGLPPGRGQYFASRAAPMGAVGADVVIATFSNFRPALVRDSLAGVWDLVEPAAVVSARGRAADVALRDALGPGVDAPEIAEAASLARTAALAASERPEGRPLFAAHAALPWPEEPHLVLWHAQTLLREFRGDAHVAALTLAGLSGIEALVTHAATGELPARILAATRGWSATDWDTAVEGLRARGLVEPADDGSTVLSAAGRAQRQWIEDATDAASVAAYEPLGDDGCARLRALARPVSRAVIDAGLLTPPAGNGPFGART